MEFSFKDLLISEFDLKSPVNCKNISTFEIDSYSFFEIFTLGTSSKISRKTIRRKILKMI